MVKNSASQASLPIAMGQNKTGMSEVYGVPAKQHYYLVKEVGG